jgi:hypothetical protein
LAQIAIPVLYNSLAARPAPSYTEQPPLWGVLHAHLVSSLAQVPAHFAQAVLIIYTFHKKTVQHAQMPTHAPSVMLGTI